MAQCRGGGPSEAGGRVPGCLGGHGVPPGLPQSGYYRSGGPQAGRRRDFTGVRGHGHERRDSPGAALAGRLYPSELYPWSKYLTGTQGTAPKNGFDPLAYWVERAHALGLELHAWVNPFRITKGGAAEFQALTADHPAKLHPDWVVEYEGDYYFNPGLPEVREYIVRGAEELARKYDIDGIHLDDYFYPGSGFADGAYAKYGKGLFQHRRLAPGQCQPAGQDTGERIHAIDPGLSYGISPSGVWADRQPAPGLQYHRAAMRATTPPTPTAGNGQGVDRPSAPRSTGTSATRARTTPRWPAGGRIR